MAFSIHRVRAAGVDPLCSCREDWGMNAKVINHQCQIVLSIIHRYCNVLTTSCKKWRLSSISLDIMTRTALLVFGANFSVFGYLFMRPAWSTRRASSCTSVPRKFNRPPFLSSCTRQSFYVVTWSHLYCANCLPSSNMLLLLSFQRTYIFAFLLSSRLFVEPHELLRRVCQVNTAPIECRLSSSASYRVSCAPQSFVMWFPLHPFLVSLTTRFMFYYLFTFLCPKHADICLNFIRNHVISEIEIALP